MNEDLNLALLQAIAKDDREAVLNLVARGVNLNGLVNDGPTPLDMTVIADRPEIARLPCSIMTAVLKGRSVRCKCSTAKTGLNTTATSIRSSFVWVAVSVGMPACSQSLKTCPHKLDNPPLLSHHREVWKPASLL